MIDSDTFLYGIFGNPVAHSLSPLMHNRAFAESGHNGVYLAFAVKDPAAALKAARAIGMKGISVTVPHKTTVMAHLDRVDENARKIGAVNTIVNQNGLLTGYNTDCQGAVWALKDKTGLKDVDAIIGAGGAACAIGFGVVSEGARLTVINRTVERGEHLAAKLNAAFLPLAETKKLNCRILINTTSVGMTPHVDAIPIRDDVIENHMLVMDIVYHPLKTRLLRVAADKGCAIIDGVSMLVYQGALQYELWTGQKAPTEVMRQVVIAKLKSTDKRT